MRVLFYVFFPAGGIGRYTNYLVRAMQEVESFGTEIVCLPEFQWANTKCYPTWPRLWSISHRWSWFRKARFLIAQFVNPRRLFKRVNEIHPEIVHLCNINHLSYPTWERLMVRSNVIVGVSVHDVRRAKAIVNKRWESWQLRRVYRRADALFVHSEAQRDDLLSYAECSHERVHVVPMGSFTSPTASNPKAHLRAQHGISDRSRVALFFGNLRDDKNLDGLIEAVGMLADDRIHLLIAGQDGGRAHRNYSSYQEQINRLELSARVTIISGFISDEDLADYFCLSDFCALPYRTTFTSQSAVLTTAVFYGLPVLVTPCPTLQETTQRFDIGEICAGDDAKSIRAGIENLIERIEQGDIFDFAGYKQYYSWKENARVTTEVYRALLKERVKTPQ